MREQRARQSPPRPPRIKLEPKLHTLSITSTYKTPLLSLDSLPERCDPDDVEKRERLGTVVGNIIWCTRYGKQYGGSRKLKIELLLLHIFLKHTRLLS